MEFFNFLDTTVSQKKFWIGISSLTVLSFYLEKNGCLLWKICRDHPQKYSTVKTSGLIMIKPLGSSQAYPYLYCSTKNPDLPLEFAKQYFWIFFSLCSNLDTVEDRNDLLVLPDLCTPVSYLPTQSLLVSSRSKSRPSEAMPWKADMESTGMSWALNLWAPRQTELFYFWYLPKRISLSCSRGILSKPPFFHLYPISSWRWGMWVQVVSCLLKISGPIRGAVTETWLTDHYC